MYILVSTLTLAYRYAKFRSNRSDGAQRDTSNLQEVHGGGFGFTENGKSCISLPERQGTPSKRRNTIHEENPVPGTGTDDGSGRRHLRIG
jgi:hypothetical protein